MLAVLALIAFAVAGLLRIIHLHGSAVTDLIIIGGILISAHGLWGYYPWRRAPLRPQG